ncbi:MAG: type IV secretory system conjugative DNA transfer family protein, partial [Deltaproteobacteria bacterium]|nr:type IV secretory system conjugative DNA transfer family protein [Deltaproteobacteria bacterium]
MPNAVYSLLLVLVFFVLVAAFLKTDLLGYVATAGIIFAVMVVLHHYLALQMIGYAVQTANPYLRYFFFRSAVTVGGAAPLLLLAVAWLARERFKPWLFYTTVVAVAYSGLWTGYDEFARLAPYYPRFSLVTLFGSADLFAVVGAVVTIAFSLAALRKARPKPRVTQPVRRAASTLHGESNWFPIEQARRLFAKGGIVIGEACRSDLNPNLGGKAPLLRYDGTTGSGHVLVFAGSGGYKTTGTVVPSALEWPAGLVCLDPSAEAVRLVSRARRALDHRVVALNPEDPNAASFNALDWIDVSTDRALLDLQAVVGWLCGETPGERYDDYFKHAARALLGCLLADLVFDPAIAPEHKTLLLLRQR